MFYTDGQVRVEEEDQCMTCENFNKGVACPLLQALGMGLVSLQDSLLVTNCSFYKQFKRHLKIVKPEKD